ncbi:MAG: coiled-coil domain-containing protein, partial [Thermoguttaceae bacterium]
SDHMRTPAALLDLPRTTEKGSTASDDLKEISDAFQRSADDGRQIQQRYQDLLAHSILTAAAGDLDGVQRYQSGVLESKAPMAWERLVRQETVVASQLRDVEQLIRKHASRLPPRLQERIYQSVDWLVERRSRLEESMESEDLRNRLQETAVRLAAELPGQQQIATVDGNLPRALIEARRELDKRSGSLSEPLRRMAEAAESLKTSTAGLAGVKDSAESQKLQTSIRRTAGMFERLEGDGFARLASRRTATQARADADTQYASDAGLTRRALVSLSGQFAEQPVEGSEIPAILGKIASAYRVLEAGHRAMQLDKALEDLVSRERWESQEISARLDHPRRWDSVQDGCEQVAKTLRDAQYPQELAGKVDQLRWSRPANEAGSKIGARRWRHTDRVAAAHELSEMKTELEGVVESIKPIMAEARTLIEQYAPTLPEMARQAAEEVRQLEKETEASAEKLAGQDEQAPAQPVDAVEQRQEEVNRQLEDLLDALAEDANRQDLLTEEGRERARDADDSTRMIQPPAARMNQAVEQAAAAEKADQQARELTQAADQQEKTADVLDQVAEHYERLERGADVAETRETLRQAERDMGIADQMQQQYDEAQQLAEMAAKSPQELMAELEAELAKNPAMQESLSEISEDALAQAKNSLERSAQQEDEMERALERSDQAYREKKQILAEELRELGRAASELANRQANQAESYAASGKDQPAREQLAAAKSQLYQEVAKAQSADADAAMENLLELAQQTAEQAAEAAQKLRQGEQSTAKSKTENVHENDQRRAEAERRLEEEQKRFHEQMLREARERARDRARNEQRADAEAKREQKELDKAQQDVNRQQELLNRKPEDQSAQRALSETQRRREQGQKELEQAQRALQRAKAQREAADQATQRLEKKELPKLAAPNPAAELANLNAREAADLAEQMANRARELAQNPDWAKQLTPQADTLRQAREQQAEIGTDVKQAAEDVGRAGRHEARLEKADLAGQLQQKARDIQKVADGEVAQSEKELEEATQEADPEKAPQQGNQQALEAHASVGEAEEAISEQVEALGETLQPSEPAAQVAASEPANPMAAGAPSPGEAQAPEGGSDAQPATPDEAAHAQMLARTLDELDQSMAGAQQSATSPAEAQGPPSTLAGAAQAQASQMAQARMQARMAARAPGRQGAQESAQGAPLVAQGGADSALQPVARLGEEWGKLRAQSADDVVGSGRDALSAEYRKQVETYFRVLAERSRKKE